MELAGWITRIAESNDKREKIVALTEKAQQTVPLWLQSIDELQKQTLNDISVEDIEVFDRVLKKMRQNLTEDTYKQQNTNIENKIE